MAFQKGKSGNPGGRSGTAGLAEWRKSAPVQKMRDAAYALLQDAVNTGFIGYRLQSGELEYEKVDPRDRLNAARELVDRIDGKPPQALTDADGGSLQFAPVIMIPAESND